MKALFVTPIALAPGRPQPVRGELTLPCGSKSAMAIRSEARWCGLAKKRALAVCLAIGLAPCPASALDCAAARRPIDKAICADPAAERADEAMSEAYKSLHRKLTPEQAHALLRNQRRWLEGRNDNKADFARDTCAIKAAAKLSSCLRSLNEDRAAILNATPEAGPGTPDPLTPFLVEKPGKNGTFDISLFLFKFLPERTKEESAFNAAIDKKVAAVAKETAPDPDIGDGTGQPEQMYHLTARITYASPRLVSLQLSTYWDGGGPHPDFIFNSINVDLQQGRELTYGDLLDTHGKLAVRKRCFEQALKQLREDSPEDQGFKAFDSDTLEHLEDLTSWSFSDRAANVSLGRIFGYAGGEYTCELPYSVLRPLAKKSFPLPG